MKKSQNIGTENVFMFFFFFFFFFLMQGDFFIGLHKGQSITIWC